MRGCCGTRQEARERAAREQGFTGYCELAREAPFYEAMSDVRLHLQKADEHLIVALSEVYIGALPPPPCCLLRATRHGLPLRIILWLGMTHSHVEDPWVSQLCCQARAGFSQPLGAMQWTVHVCNHFACAHCCKDTLRCDLQAIRGCKCTQGHGLGDAGSCRCCGAMASGAPAGTCPKR